MRVTPIIYNGQITYTAGQVDVLTDGHKGKTRHYVNHNREKFVEGLHYFQLAGADIEAIKASVDEKVRKKYIRNTPKRMRLFTQEGIKLLRALWGMEETKTPSLPVEVQDDQLQIDNVEQIEIEGDKVDGRQLHAFLQVRTAYKDWFPRMVEYGGFEEGRDFCSKMSESLGRPLTDHDLTIDMAKHLCMIQRTERGKQARDYFIRCEKKLKEMIAPSYSIDDQIARARAWIAEQEAHRLKVAQLEASNKEQAKAIEEMKPLAMLGKAVSAAADIYIGDLAKILTQHGIVIGRNNLFKRLRKEGYITSYGGSNNMPMQRYVESGLFRVKEGVRVHPKTGELLPCMTTMVTGKGQLYFINKFTKEAQEGGK